jgi:homoaconitase/3-isopropylmalate dehydratase large subunit
MLGAHRTLLPVQSEVTVVEQYASLAHLQSDHDAALYAAEAALKAARLAPVLKEEQSQQASLLRQIVSYPVSVPAVLGSCCNSKHQALRLLTARGLVAPRVATLAAPTAFAGAPLGLHTRRNRRKPR